MDNYLFGQIMYEDDEKLSNFINQLSIDQVLYIINVSLEFAHSKGIYDLKESELVSKSVRLLNQFILSKNDKSTSFNNQ